MNAARKPITRPVAAVSPTDDPDPFFGGVPINVLDSEGVFLSHCLMHPEQAGALVAMLKPEHFYATANQRVFEAYFGLHDDGAEPDAVMVANRMRALGTLTQSGGTSYLAMLADCTPACAKPELHAAQIRQAWKQRELMAVMSRQAILLRHGQVDHAGAIAALREHVKMVKA